jgi:hypothetical protein
LIDLAVLKEAEESADILCLFFNSKTKMETQNESDNNNHKPISSPISDNDMDWWNYNDSFSDIAKCESGLRTSSHDKWANERNNQTLF